MSAPVERRRVIALWSPPRARSTGFFRAMLERGDLLALHEPFCNLVDFGETEVADRTVRDAAELIAAMRAEAQNRSVFFKDTTEYRYAEVLADRRFLSETTHTFLIRRPEEITASFYALRPDMRREEVGLEQLFELYEAARAYSAHPPIVVESDDLVDRPMETMTAYCGAVGIPFVPEALRWSAGVREEWRRSARWHVDVSETSGLGRRTRSYQATAENTPVLAAFSAHHRPFYERLQAVRLVVGTEAAKDAAAPA
ncbi:MAG: sulfotransferase family protein [Actinomycetota bacterium]